MEDIEMFFCPSCIPFYQQCGMRCLSL